MQILVLDHPREGVTFEDYLPHLSDETKHAWQGIKSEKIRQIYFRKDRPGVVIIMEADSVEQAQSECNGFPLAKAGLLDFECIPFGNYTMWENLFKDEHKVEE